MGIRLNKSTSEKWEDRFDLEMMGSLVVHVYETKQFEDIKKFIAKEIKNAKREVLGEVIKNFYKKLEGRYKLADGTFDSLVNDFDIILKELERKDE